MDQPDEDEEEDYEGEVEEEAEIAEAEVVEEEGDVVRRDYCSASATPSLPHPPP